MMEYNGYSAKIEFDPEANVFHGRVVNLRDVITFEGTSVEELNNEFRESIDDYLEFCAERGEEPEKPYSGKFLVRVSPVLHRNIAIASARAGQSVNAWVSDVLERAIGVNLAPPAFALADLPSVYGPMASTQYSWQRTWVPAASLALSCLVNETRSSEPTMPQVKNRVAALLDVDEFTIPAPALANAS